MPHKVPTHPLKSRPQPRTPPLVHRPLGHRALRPHPRNDPIRARLNHHATDNHLAQRRVQRLEVEDEVKLAHVLEQAVQRLDVNLDDVDEGQRRLGRRRDDDEVQRRVVPVRHERRDVVVRLRGRVRGARGGKEGREREEVAGPGRAVGDESENFGDEALLDRGVLLRGGA
jgi:hypothetical protein